eukprot:310866-Rhodomonas_salina.3
MMYVHTHIPCRHHLVVARSCAVNAFLFAVTHELRGPRTDGGVREGTLQVDARPRGCHDAGRTRCLLSAISRAVHQGLPPSPQALRQDPHPREGNASGLTAAVPRGWSEDFDR